MNKARKIIVKRTREELVKRFPACFVDRKETPRPIKIGIHRDIFARAPDIPQSWVRWTMRHYVGNWLYHLATVIGVQRVDLDGADAGPVTLENSTHAEAQLLKYHTQRGRPIVTQPEAHAP